MINKDIEIAEKLQDLRILAFRDGYSVMKDSKGYFFAGVSSNFIVNLKTVARGEKKEVFRLFDYYVRSGRVDLKIVGKKFKVVKKIKKIKYTPFTLNKKNIEELMEF